MINYDFKIEIYNQTAKDAKGDPLLKFEISSENNGIQLQGSITPSFVSETMVSYHKASVRIYNMDFSFAGAKDENDKPLLAFGDRIVLYYRTNWNPDWQYVMAGLLSIPEDSDSENGDYTITLTINQISRNKFFKKELNKNYKGMTILKALQDVLETRLGSIDIDEGTQNLTISESFYCVTVDEFLNRIQQFGGFAIRTSYGSALNTLADDNLFNIQKRATLAGRIKENQAKNLEDWGLNFIPQLSLEVNNDLGSARYTWSAKTLFTNKLNVGDTVTFKDRLNVSQYGIIQEISHVFSTRGECSSTLKIVDQRSYPTNRIEGGTS